MAFAPVRADAGADELPMPSPLQWHEAPLSQRIGLLRCGAPADWIRHTETRTGLTRAELCELLGLKVSTVNRKLQNRTRLSPDETERLMGLQRLIGLVEAVVRDCGDGSPFDAGAWLVHWLERPNHALGGQSPAAFMDTADGREHLSRLIGAQRSGAYL